MATSSVTQAAAIRAGLSALFATGVFNITFIKADGILRTLKVTTDPDLLPAPSAEAGTRSTTRAVNDSIVSVFDLDAKAWKSFTVADLISLSAVFE